MHHGISESPMNLSEYSLMRGKILYVSGDEVWLGHGLRLMYSNDNGKTWRTVAVLPPKTIRERLAIFRLGQRLLRIGFHHFARVTPSCIYIIAHNYFFKFENIKNSLERLGALVGSRPLKVCAANGLLYFGTYTGNRNRKPIFLWSLKQESTNVWESVWKFENIRHIHGTFYDPYTKAIWITTGDQDDEVGIWRTDDNFISLVKVVGETQQFRVIQLLFTAEHVYFGSDAPDEKNYLYRMDREGRDVEKLAAVGSSVFHGCKVGSCLYFSTAVEPSRVNTNSYAEIWGSTDGINWQIVQRFKKDIWPRKLFQYGQVFFPGGPGDGENLWFTPFATEHDQKTFKIPLSQFVKYRPYLT